MSYSKTKTTIQMEAAGCGAASLKMLLDYYKCHLSLEEISLSLDIGRDGCTIGDIRRVGASLGLLLEANEVTPEQLKKFQPPFILWWDHTHFLIYEGFNNSKFILNDPAIGRRYLSIEEFSNSFSGVYIYVVDSTALIQTRSSHIYSGRKLLLNFVSPSLLPIFLAILLFTFTILPSLMTAGLTSYFIDEVLINGQIDNAISLLWVFLLISGISALSIFTSYRLLNESNFNNSVVQCNRFMELVMSLPLRWLESKNNRELAVRLVLPLNTVNNLNYTLISSLISFSQGLIVVFFLICLNFTIGCLSLSVFILCCYFALVINNQTLSANLTLSVKDGQQQSQALFALSDIEQIRSTGSENSAFATWAGYYTSFINAQQDIQNSQSLMFLISKTSYYILFTFLLCAGPILIITGQLSLGDFLAIQLLIGFISSGISSIPILLTQFQQLISPIARYRNAFEASSLYSINMPQCVTELPPFNDSRPCNLNLNLNDVDFFYNINSKIFSHFSLNDTFSPGIISVEGLPSSGKTTFLKLLCGLYSPISGSLSLSYNNNDIGLTSIPFIPRFPQIFDGTYLDNVSFLDSSLDDDFLNKSLSESGLSHLLKDLDRSIYDSIPSNGDSLSGKELSSVVLSRILCLKSRIICIDSSFSYLPSDTMSTYLDILLSRFSFIFMSHSDNISSSFTSQKITLDNR